MHKMFGRARERTVGLEISLVSLTIKVVYPMLCVHATGSEEVVS